MVKKATKRKPARRVETLDEQDRAEQRRALQRALRAQSAIRTLARQLRSAMTRADGDLRGLRLVLEARERLLAGPDRAAIDTATTAAGKDAFANRTV